MFRICPAARRMRKTLAGPIAGLIVIGVFAFVDWRQLLEQEARL